jgi:3-methyl-2-oxobutanoate hydroxymethyltransferase
MTRKRLSVLDIQQKRTGGRIVMATAYDYPLALLAEQAGLDAVLVSDALGMVGLGYASTIQVTLDEMVHHTKAVARGAKDTLLLSSMPFMSASLSIQAALANAARLVQEGGADGVEVEGGPEIVETVAALVTAGIPVMPHIGLTRQHHSRFGSYGVRGRGAAEAFEIVKLSQALQDAGAFAILLECIPDRLSRIVTEEVDIPTIGIGAGPHCDGQVLVSQDLLGLYQGFRPRFAKRYVHLSNSIRIAYQEYAEEVKSGDFPGPEHSYDMDDAEFSALMEMCDGGGCGRCRCG